MNEAEVPQPADDPTELPEESRGLIPAWVKAALVLVVLAGGVAFLLVGSDASDAFVYSRMVDEVLDRPEAHLGRELRVEGKLKQGSIKFREDPCEWRFTITHEGNELPVAFPQCVVPDTFRDGMGITVTVQGQLQKTAHGAAFQANQVVPRCPSKYEMQEKLKKGEEIPHDMPTAS